MENKEKILKRLYLVIIVILLVLIIIVIAASAKIRAQQSKTPDQVPETITEEKLFAGVIKPEETVTVDTRIIEDGLRQMGILITEEYYFTQVEEYTSTEKAWIFDSTATFTYSYDGTVSAGIDCSKVRVDRDEENKRITISVPKAEIQSVVIDHNSFKIYEEKNGLWNKLDMTKYNASLVEFENAAKKKALEKGILEKADEGAEKMLRSFVNSVGDIEAYTIDLVTQ